MVRGGRVGALFFALMLAPETSAFAQSEEAADYHTPRYEAAGFPLLAGSSDVGVKTGAVGTLKRFEEGVRPYRWNVDLLLAASFKEGPTAIEIAQQSYILSFDVAGLGDGQVRSGSHLRYTRTINQNYFGVGNASSSQLPASVEGQPGRYFQFVAPELEVRQLTRIRVHRPIDAVITTIYRYEAPETYPGSKLAQDGARVLGLHSLSLLSLGGGVIYDTRDNEPFPSSGMRHLVGAKYVQGFPVDDQVRYGQAGGFFAGYVPLGGGFVYAARVAVDLQFGNVPFFDLYRAGPFESYEMIGGSTGIRGVPVGRYLGPIKVLANQEVRLIFARFSVFEQNFRVGGNVLFDVGRLWSDYSFRAREDGSGVGLRWGAGGGIYLGWGQASIFRIEAAYSTEAVAANPSFPIGLYVNDGVAF